MHWIWANEPASEQEAMIYTAPEVVERHDLRFNQGQFVTETFPVIVLVQDAQSQGTLTDNLIAPGVNGLVFSFRLRKVLAQAAIDNFQYFPCVVVNLASGHRTNDYMVANVLGRIACIDRENSDLDMDPGDPERIEFINSLAIDESKAHELPFFRLHEKPQVIVVSPRVKTACEQAEITGVRFYAPADFTF